MRTFAKIFDLEVGQTLVRLERDEDDNFVIVVTIWSEDQDAPLHAHVKPQSVTGDDSDDAAYDLFLAFTAEQAQQVVEFFDRED